MGFYKDLMGYEWDIPSGELSHFAMERSTQFCSWENDHYFDWAIFNCKLLVHQRVSYIIVIS